MQGHPGASKMLVELRKRYYIPNFSEHVSKFVSNCTDCLKAKPVNPKRLTPPLEKIYDHCNGPEDILEVDLVLMRTAGIQIEQATVKHAQTIGMVECSHQRLKQILKINVATDSPQWDKYINLAVMAHNTTYHQALRCTPSEVFYGRVPFNALELKFSNPLQCRTQETDLTKLIDQVIEKYKQVNNNILQADHKYKRYYDRKPQASTLIVNDIVFLLNPKTTDQSDKMAINNFKWEGPFKVVKVLTNFNYIIRKVGTFRTQCVHRMRLRPFIPNAPIQDIDEVPILFFADPEASDDQELVNDHLPRTIHFERKPALAAPEELDTEHGIIYYERVQR